MVNMYKCCTAGQQTSIVAIVAAVGGGGDINGSNRCNNSAVVVVTSMAAIATKIRIQTESCGQHVEERGETTACKKSVKGEGEGEGEGKTGDGEVWFVLGRECAYMLCLRLTKVFQHYSSVP